MSRVLFIQADSRLLNPQLDAQMIAEAYADDAEAAKSEWGGLFRSDVGEYLSDELIDAAIATGRTHLDPRPGVIYTAFCDMSSGAGSDAAALAIAHAERDEDGNTHFVQDLLLSRWPPFSPEAVCEEFSGALARYGGISSVTTDRFAQGWVAAALERRNVACVYSEHDRSSIYGEAAKLFVERRVELLHNEKLITQTRTLERTPRSGGRQDLIDHPRGAHDDLINCTAGALLLVAQRAERESVVPEEIAVGACSREAAEARYAPRILAAVVADGRCILARRVGRTALAPSVYSGDARDIAGAVSAQVTNWSCHALYVCDVEPGAPVYAMLQQLNCQPIVVDLFGNPTGPGYADRRSELAFELAAWLEAASVPQTLLHDLTAHGYVTRSGITELIEAPLGMADALAMTLINTDVFQHPRSITGGTNISQTARAYDVLADRGESATSAGYFEQSITDYSVLEDRG